MIIIEEYNEKVKTRLSSQAGKKMIRNIFKKYTDIGYQL